MFFSEAMAIDQKWLKDSFTPCYNLAPGVERAVNDFIHKMLADCGQTVQKKIVWRATLTHTNGSGSVEKKS